MILKLQKSSIPGLEPMFLGSPPKSLLAGFSGAIGSETGIIKNQPYVLGSKLQNISIELQSLYVENAYFYYHPCSTPLQGKPGWSSTLAI